MMGQRLKIGAYALLFMILLLGCGAAPSEGASLVNEQPNATIPPEPSNTPPPPTIPPVEGDPCSVAGQQQQIDAAYASYQANRTTEAPALPTLNEWVSITTAEIVATCANAVSPLSEPNHVADMLAKLQAGGYVIYVRHTHTDRSRGDTNVSFGECEQQRILSEQGREEALMIRNAYQQLDLPVSFLLSTQYCRTIETAVLAFGVPKVISRADLTATLPDWLATEPAPGTNSIIVAHIGTVRDRVGLDDTFEEGDSFVYRPTGSGEFEFFGRIGLYDWAQMAALQTIP